MRSIVLIILIVFLCPCAIAETLSGVVNEQRLMTGSGYVFDEKTGRAVPGATVSIPSENIITKTDRNGMFKIPIPKGKQLILSVNKEGFTPYSLAIDNNDSLNPMKIGISEKNRNKIVIDSELHHLGDNKFSERSANAGDFSVKADGSYFLQEFYVSDADISGNAVLTIGSTIGIDTKDAQESGQNDVRSAYSSPVKVYLNSVKIGEISLNGDNWGFQIPPGLLKINRYNIIKIETGVNLDTDRDTDYDDMEFMNLFLETH